MGVIDLPAFADAVGSNGPVTISGSGSRGGPVHGVRCVHPPAGISWVQPDEMIVSCGAGTSISDLDMALADHGQRVALPTGGTVGGALAVGTSGIRRLGDGPVRDTLLQASYVSAAGVVVTAGGPTVKNVSGFDLCRLLVGSRGTLGFLGEVILRTRPIARCSQWFSAPAAEPFTVFAQLYRPISVLWNGSHLWALLEGDPSDVAAQAQTAGLRPTDGPPALPTGSRRSILPADVVSTAGTFVAEVGIGIVHHIDPWAPPPLDARLVALNDAIRGEFDPTGRLNRAVV